MTGPEARVLLVDDDEAKRYLMGTWLRRAGHTVIEVGTGREALEKAGSAELVLLDVNLPDMIGYEVCRQIKDNPATPAIGTVLLADDDAAFRGVLMGLLSGLATQVIEAENGPQALALVAAHPVDVILTDMRMPGMDGAALLARLPAPLPAIVITGTDVPPPPRAAAVLRKDELTRERLEFTLRVVIGGEP